MNHSVGFENFCGGSLWDPSIILNRTVPELTMCMRTTFLTWIPVSVYFLLLAPYMRMLKGRKIQPKTLSKSKLFYSKMITSLLLSTMCTLLLISGLVERHWSLSIIPDSYFVNWMILLVAFVSTIFLIDQERLHGKYSSFMLFILFLALTITSIPSIMSIAADIANIQQCTGQLYVMYFILLCIQLINTLNVEQYPYGKSGTENRELCPEPYQSVLSKLYFTYVGKLVRKGFKRNLQMEDLWELDANEKTEALVERLENTWNKAVLNLKGDPSSFQMVPLQLTSDSRDVRKSSNGERLRFQKFCNWFRPRKIVNPRLLLVLMKAFPGKLIASAFLKIFHDCLQFCPPLILQLIITFLESKTQPLWLGVMYSLLMLIVMMVQSCVLHQYFLRMMLSGQRWRTALIAMIYKKSLRLCSTSRQTSTVGEIVNLMTVDAQRLLELTSYMQIIWSGPLQIVIAMVLLWNTLGPSVIAGLLLLILAIPVNGFLTGLIKKYQSRQMKLKDFRIKEMNEILNGIKVVKLYAWEEPFLESVSKTRDSELVVLRKTAIVQAVVSLIWTIIPFLVTAVTFIVYTLVDQNNVLTADKIFVSLTLFGLLRFPLFMLATVITSFAQAKVSMRRLESFFSLNELDDSVVQKKRLEGNAIEINHCTCTWSADSFSLNTIYLNIPKKSLAAVVGDVGSGKSALINAILGEMDCQNGSIAVDGTIAFVPQQPWIINATLRDNITMLRPYNDALYNNVLQACTLSVDLTTMPNGDLTEIGEKGINLSGGQKQRVSLARAIYSNADVYLLDDPLSAVDSHVAKHIFTHVIGPTGILSKKTRLFVTNALSFIPRCDQVIMLRQGSIVESGTYKDLLAKNGSFANLAKQYVSEIIGDPEQSDITFEMLEDLPEEHSRFLLSEISFDCKSPKKGTLNVKQKTHRIARQTISKFRGKSKRDDAKEKSKLSIYTPKKTGKLVEAEKMEEGTLKREVIVKYFKCYGLITMIALPIFYMVAVVANIGSSLWLSNWSEKAIEEANSTSARNRRIAVYVTLGTTQALFYFACQILLMYGAYWASVILHRDIVQRLLRGTMQFFDTTPTGRIINRISKDIDAVDFSLPQSIRSATQMFISIAATLVIIVLTNPIFVAVAIPIFIIFHFLQRFYIATSRQLRRLESVSRSPIYSHFGETIQGLQSIRSCGLTEAFIHKNNSMNNLNMSTYYPSILINRWLAMILETLANIIVFTTCILAVTSRGKNMSGLSALAISSALGITQSLNWLVRMISEIETNIVAVERVIEYCNIDIEPDWINDKRRPDEDWPDKGTIDFETFSLKYRDYLEPALREITMHVNSGEKIGLVGRTGAGKSSLTVGLFRLVDYTSGSICIDGVPIKELGLHDLRSRLTVLPQDPIIFSRSLRSNLDPFNQYTDEMIWDALRHSTLDQFVSRLPGKLEYMIAESGENLSAGQKQLFCLARALLRKTKILVLDEATAAVDVETDDVIQSTIRSEFKDCTVLTIAHRINTITDYDRIAVFDQGRLVEFDSPRILMSSPDSIFASLVKDANLNVEQTDDETE